MAKRTNEVLTTGEVAKAFGVSIQTVIRWIDTGFLRGWLVPGSGHRRVDRAVFDQFVKEFELRPDQLEPVRRLYAKDAEEATKKSENQRRVTND